MPGDKLIKSDPKNKITFNNFYKTKICPWYQRGVCRWADECNYAHSNEERRGAVDLTKTTLCPHAQAHGTHCGDINCRYAHTHQELRATTDVYKTSMCSFYSKGTPCPLKDNCRFAHGSHELRQKPVLESSTIGITNPPLNRKSPGRRCSLQKSTLACATPSPNQCRLDLPSANRLLNTIDIRGISNDKGLLTLNSQVKNNILPSYELYDTNENTGYEQIVSNKNYPLAPQNDAYGSNQFKNFFNLDFHLRNGNTNHVDKKWLNNLSVYSTTGDTSNGSSGHFCDSHTSLQTCSIDKSGNSISSSTTESLNSCLPILVKTIRTPEHPPQPFSIDNFGMRCNIPVNLNHNDGCNFASELNHKDLVFKHQIREPFSLSFPPQLSNMTEAQNISESFYGSSPFSPRVENFSNCGLPSLLENWKNDADQMKYLNNDTISKSLFNNKPLHPSNDCAFFNNALDNSRIMNWTNSINYSKTPENSHSNLFNNESLLHHFDMGKLTTSSTDAINTKFHPKVMSSTLESYPPERELFLQTSHNIEKLAPIKLENVDSDNSLDSQHNNAYENTSTTITTSSENDSQVVSQSSSGLNPNINDFLMLNCNGNLSLNIQYGNNDKSLKDEIAEGSVHNDSQKVDVYKNTTDNDVSLNTTDTLPSFDYLIDSINEKGLNPNDGSYENNSEEWKSTHFYPSSRLGNCLSFQESNLSVDMQGCLSSICSLISADSKITKIPNSYCINGSSTISNSLPLVNLQTKNYADSKIIPTTLDNPNEYSKKDLLEKIESLETRNSKLSQDNLKLQENLKQLIGDFSDLLIYSK